MLRGEWKLCRVKEVFPDCNGLVRNVKVALLPASIDGSSVYKKGLEKIYVERHVKNLIVIVPCEDQISSH